MKFSISKQICGTEKYYYRLGGASVQSAASPSSSCHGQNRTLVYSRIHGGASGSHETVAVEDLSLLNQISSRILQLIHNKPAPFFVWCCYGMDGWRWIAPLLHDMQLLCLSNYYCSALQYLCAFCCCWFETGAVSIPTKCTTNQPLGRRGAQNNRKEPPDHGDGGSVAI